MQAASAQNIKTLSSFCAVNWPKHQLDTDDVTFGAKFLVFFGVSQNK